MVCETVSVTTDADQRWTHFQGGRRAVVIVGTTPRLVGRSGRTGTVSPAASDGKLGRDMSVRPRDTEAHSGGAGLPDVKAVSCARAES